VHVINATMNNYGEIKYMLDNGQCPTKCCHKPLQTTIFNKSRDQSDTQACTCAHIFTLSLTSSCEHISMEW
jgi:hypothetical protein